MTGPDLDLIGLKVKEINSIGHILAIFKQRGFTTIDSVVNHIDEYVSSNVNRLIEEQTGQRSNIQRITCDHCGVLMTRYPVNSCDSTKVEGDYSFVLICSNCHNERWY